MAIPPVDAAAKGVGLVQAEARGEQRGLEQQHDQVLHRLVALVCVSALAQLLQGDSTAVVRCHEVHLTQPQLSPCRGGAYNALPALA